MIEVVEDEYQCVATSPTNDICLTSGAIGPCICIMASGSFGSVNYIAMHHWSGFSLGLELTELTMESEISNIFRFLALTIATKLSLFEDDEDAVPSLHILYLLGGQHEERDLSTGELISSGTEREVNALAKYVRSACNNNFVTMSDTRYMACHYATTGTEDLRVFFSFSKICVEKNSEYRPMEQDDSEDDMSTTSTYNPMVVPS